MSFFPGKDPEVGDAFASDQIELMVVPNAKDIGGFQVRRALPTAKRRLVGPFIFFDRMGPAILRAGQALDVRPHPHIGLSTVTYLFDGKIRHRDSLGTEMVIQPGDVNLMTAGRGIVHSERTPEELRGAPMSISGLQTWLALPDDKEEVAPVFENTGALRLPEIDAEGVNGRLIIGDFQGLRSPVRADSETLYADLRLAPGASVKIPADAEERAIYTLEGEVSISGDVFPAERLLVFRPGDEIVVSSQTGAHFMLFGGASLGSKRYIWWNFVSSSKERIEQAKEEWKTGRFDIVPGDEEEFIPLPES
ncbi:pirin family protein [Mesorhizobium sp. M7A.F.Ca.US.006.04.2.1]|uniref:pirin family protein n=2 Tax=Mesorhizobium TaxID=68287 RepID=UPI000FCC2AC1|nr:MULTISPECIES: pirin family protein [unclassified Mesorhizobium]RUX73312.1 pirin family protein [Mesorhizobium sp. M7A.F.Ca.US.005.03.1.1]RUY23809.1 pirin family protein [Mesorhizobium sp. M7A.F.Ca.US.001.04.2.1]RUY43805.1 pirin family protein [Mesorhizobium sp. M7A.F.Ca.US.001.04.1.1]RVA06301.1 pirin family protein [Mesorhizobium sp. M7A.F.Ca.US.001.02.1.1]RVA11934.1 pirin family protein [Mesorhizobium sp. M7A.F.Ca.US.002.01.1.1]